MSAGPSPMTESIEAVVHARVPLPSPLPPSLSRVHVQMCTDVRGVGGRARRRRQQARQEQRRQAQSGARAGKRHNKYAAQADEIKAAAAALDRR